MKSETREILELPTCNSFLIAAHDMLARKRFAISSSVLVFAFLLISKSVTFLIEILNRRFLTTIKF
jgi:hypothetical protein